MDYYLQMIQFDRQIILQLKFFVIKYNVPSQFCSLSHVLQFVGTAIPNKLRTITRKCDNGSELTIPPLLPINPTGFILT